MYKLIGADGKEYGPVSAGVLREWIAQGRASANTHVLLEGTSEWRTLAQLPEFADALGVRTGQPPVPGRLPAAIPPPATNPLATTGLVLGIFSITIGLCCCYGFPFNVAGIVCSAIALVQINREPERQQGKGIAIAGLIISILSLLLSGLLMILWGVFMAMPNATHHLPRW